MTHYRRRRQGVQNEGVWVGKCSNGSASKPPLGAVEKSAEAETFSWCPQQSWPPGVCLRTFKGMPAMHLFVGSVQFLQVP